MIVEKTVETVYIPLNKAVKTVVLYEAILAKGTFFDEEGSFDGIIEG